MKDFGNYECEGQMSLFDMYPKPCCGVVPWLELHKCYQPDTTKPPCYRANYICPVCFKEPVDSIGWMLEGYGELEKAKQEALEYWNDPKNKRKKISDLHVPWHDIERFKGQYGEKVIFEGGKYRVGKENEL